MKRLVSMVALLLVLLHAGHSATPQSTVFTYQGNLSENNAPANGNFDLTFTLFDAETGGNQVGSTVPKTGIPVTNGKFTTDLAFPGVFTGNQLWVEVTVDSQTLTPRQPINTVPVAQYALTAPTPPTPSPVFMSSAATATLTTDGAGNPVQVGVLPISGYTSAAYATTVIAGLGWVNLTPTGSNTPPAPQLFMSDGIIDSVRSRIVLEQPYSGLAGTLTVQVFTAFAGAGALTSPSTALCSVPISGPAPISNAYDCAQSGLAMPYTAGTGAILVVSLTGAANASLQAQVAASIGP